MTDEIRRAVYRALCACLEMTPESREASGMIRPVTPEGESPPRISRSENVIYYDLLSESAPDAGYTAAAAEKPSKRSTPWFSTAAAARTDSARARSPACGRIA